MDQLHQAAYEYLLEARQNLIQSLPDGISSAILQTLATADFSSVMTVMGVRNTVQKTLKEHDSHLSDQGSEWVELYSALIGATMYLEPAEIVTLLIGNNS